jgi:hypothetical protein
MTSKDTKCAPDKHFTDGSCFSIESLKKIATEYNKNNTRHLIHINDNKKNMVKQLTKAFSKSCSSQTCWLQTNIVKKIRDDDIHQHTFRPIGPSNGYDWLSTSNINNVLNQYEKKYDDFVFLGALPNDFQELKFLGFSDINFDDFTTEGKTKLGFVINLDTHDKSGSHWVALYTNLQKYQIYYFDSLGQKPGPRIRKFNKKILSYMYKKKNNKELKFNNLIKKIKSSKDVNFLNDFDIRYNNIQHQLKDSECGVYSMNFIIRAVKGESFDDITTNITTDSEINECRDVYFRSKN